MVFVLNFILVALWAYLLAASGQEQCSHPADIVFLVDDSRSIWGPDFRKELDFVRYLVGQFEVSENKTRVALATFSEGVREQFPLWKFNSASQIQLVVDQIIQYNGGTTDIFAALRYARENLFKVARPNVPHIIILITDGVSQRENETITEATLTKAKGIDILVIGVGSMDVTQLKLMASQPSEDFFFTVSNFPELTNIKSLVATQACQVSGDQAQQECKTKPSEVVFVLDKSSSIYILDFKKQLQFVSDLIDIFDIGVNKTRVAAVSFSTNASVEFHLDEFSTKQDIKDRIAKVIYTGGITATGLALTKVRDEVLSSAHGFRPDVPTMVIVITDGRSQNYIETRQVAKTLKDAGVHMIAIGVGGDIDPQELKDIGSSPYDQYVFEVNGYDALNTIKNIIAYTTCSSGAQK